MTDEDLMLAYCEGDETAFAELEARYREPLFRVLDGRLKDHAAAEDVAQLTWLRVSRHRDRFDAGRKFKPWLFTIGDRLAKNELRRRVHVDLPDCPTPPVFTEPDAGEIKAAIGALHSLPTPERTPSTGRYSAIFPTGKRDAC